MPGHAPSVAIVGSGFGGIAAAIALLRDGVTGLTIFEKTEDLGSVWRENTHPGAACDVPSHVYSFSYLQHRDWSSPCSPQEEIHDYLQEAADVFGVTPRIRFSTEVTRAAWDEGALRWRLDLSDGTTAQADVFQRTPNDMLPRRGLQYTAPMRAAIRYVPGLQAARRRGMLLMMETMVNAGALHAAPCQSTEQRW